MNIRRETTEWLLEKENPSIRYRTLRELFGRPDNDPEVLEAKRDVISGPAAARILDTMHPDGYWLVKNKNKGTEIGDGVDYTDFNTTHFCLAYLAELGLTRELPRIEKAGNRYLDLQQPDGDFLRHFSCLNGLNVRTFVRLGFRDDSRLQRTVDLMLNTERSDGGYLCDMHEGKYKTKPVKSCIRGSVKALLAFADLPEYRQHPRCKGLVDYFLNRDCLFRSNDLSEPVNHDIMATIFPITWRAGLVEVVYALSTMGYGTSPHMQKAWELLETKKNEQGEYILDWTPAQVQKLLKVGKRTRPNKWITLYALLAEKARIAQE